MQRWKNSKIASSLLNLLGDGPSARALDSRLEAVRGAMLDELFNALDTGAQRTILFVKLKGASEIQTLWYLRSDLMQVLSAHWGETEAMQRLDALTQHFKGMVPKPQLQSAQRRRAA
jgi:hypothetical protein